MVGDGFYFEPTILTGATPDASIAQEEVFGPVLTVLRYRDDDDAVAIANNSQYGLSGAVWGADVDRAVAVARRVRTGRGPPPICLRGRANVPARAYRAPRRSCKTCRSLPAR